MFFSIQKMIWFLAMPPSSLIILIPSAGNLAKSSVALAEWLSLAWWGIRGEL